MQTTDPKTGDTTIHVTCSNPPCQTDRANPNTIPGSKQPPAAADDGPPPASPGGPTDNKSPVDGDGGKGKSEKGQKRKGVEHRSPADRRNDTGR